MVGELERQYRKTGSLCIDSLIDDKRGSKETAVIGVSAVLKRYLQSFSEPLIPSKINEELLALISDRVDIDDQASLLFAFSSGLMSKKIRVTALRVLAHYLIAANEPTTSCSDGHLIQLSCSLTPGQRRRTSYRTLYLLDQSTEFDVCSKELCPGRLIAQNITSYSYISRVNARLLTFICAHLERVASNSDRNKMTTKNLALIWSGTLFRLPPSTPIGDATDKMQRLPVIVFFFIKYHNILFCNL